MWYSCWWKKHSHYFSFDLCRICDCWTKTSPNARQISNMLNCAIPAEVKGDRRISFYFFDHQYNFFISLPKMWRLLRKKMQMQNKSLEYCIATKYPIMLKITSEWWWWFVCSEFVTVTPFSRQALKSYPRTPHQNKTNPNLFLHGYFCSTILWQ